MAWGWFRLPGIPIYEQGLVIGRGEYELQGLRVRFRCALKGEGLRKVFLVRDSHRLLLGTPIPTGQGLVLERILSRSELEHAGVWPPERMETGGQGSKGPELRDPILHGVFASKPWQWRRLETGWEASIDWDGRGRFPAMALVCLVRLEARGEEWRLICRLDEALRPELPPG